MLGIAFDESGQRSVGDFAVGVAEKLRIDLIRDSLALGTQAFIFHGEPDSGKTALASQVAAIVGEPYVPLDSTEVLSGAKKGALFKVSTGDDDSIILFDHDQMRMLRAALAHGAVVHLTNADPALQRHLARAVSGHAGLAIQPLDAGGRPQGQAMSVIPHEGSLAIFEIGPGGPAGSLDMPHASLLTPIHFDGLSPEAVEARDRDSYSISGGGELVPDAAYREMSLSDMAQEREIGRVIPALIASGGGGHGRDPRASLQDGIVERLRGANGDLDTPEGRGFVNRWLGMVELQAYAGDRDAVRTLQPVLRAFASAEDLEEARLGDLLSPWADWLHQAGAVADVVRSTA